jgi:carboxyl-terminal processing protease
MESCGEGFWLEPTRVPGKDSPPSGVSRKMLLGFVIRQSKIPQGYSPASPFGLFRENRTPWNFHIGSKAVLPTRRVQITLPAKLVSYVLDMKKRIIYGVLFVTLSLNLFVGAQIYWNSAHAAEENNPYYHMELFARVLDKVRKEYVDSDKVSYEALIHGALRGMLSTLDPHSEFMEAQKYEDLRNDTEGAFGGVGIVVGLRDNGLTVIAPMEDTPAYRAGILAGDRIVKIEGKNTERVTLNDAVKKLRGDPGSQVTLTVSRPTLAAPKDFILTRAIIKVDTVKDIDSRRMFPISENKIGYIRLTQFGEQTTSDLRDALKKLKGHGMEGLVLDLRNNPGGLLDQAVKVCEVFVPRGQLIVSTEGRGAQAKYEYVAKGRDEFPNLKIVILVNNGSASASEIVAGCLQDLGRAFVMGEQTFGKGSVQSIVPLQDGSALRLTTAKYYTPSHKVIHGKGITPDSIVPMSEEEEEALFLKRVPGGLETLDEEKRERVQNAKDVQLERALDFLKGMILFQDRPQYSKKLAAQR